MAICHTVSKAESRMNAHNSPCRRIVRPAHADCAGSTFTRTSGRKRYLGVTFAKSNRNAPRAHSLEGRNAEARSGVSEGTGRKKATQEVGRCKLSRQIPRIPPVLRFAKYIITVALAIAPEPAPSDPKPPKSGKSRPCPPEQQVQASPVAGPPSHRSPAAFPPSHRLYS